MISIQQLSKLNMIGSLILVSYLAYNQINPVDSLPLRTKNSIQTGSHRSAVPTIKEVFSDFEGPLLEAALHRGESPKEILPDPKLIDSAIASKSIHSPESKKVLTIYEQGYVYYDLPFPALNGQNHSHSNPEQPGETIDAQSQIIQAYFQGQMLRIARAANKQNIAVQDSIPNPKEIEDAVRSGSIDSPTSQVVLQKIQATYKQLNIPYHPPVAP